jgi:hypothetical protein
MGTPMGTDAAANRMSGLESFASFGERSGLLCERAMEALSRRAIAHGGRFDPAADRQPGIR